MALLDRIVTRILPFHTPEAENFLKRHHHSLDRAAQSDALPYAHRLDANIGVANWIDKTLAREEAHRLLDYTICLKEIDRILRLRHPGVEPVTLDTGVYDTLLEQMGKDGDSGQRAGTPDWDYDVYGSPSYFLAILRRHAVTGAFCHPRHGGNIGAAGWNWLGHYFRDANGNTCFDWRRAIEHPLGSSTDYLG